MFMTTPLEMLRPSTELKLRVLVVDDDVDLCEFLSIGLARVGMESAIAHDGEAAIAALKSRIPGYFNLILLDVSMPKKNGWELLDSLRSSGDEVPVIFVSGRDAPAEKIRGLKLGADDYVVKPFVLDELIARMEAVLRRRRSLAPILIGELKLDLARRRTERAGQIVDLSPREFDLLLAFAKADGRTLSRQELLERVWDIKFDPGTNLLDVHLGRLRRKLDRHGKSVIATVRGEGYRLALENLGA
jgi:DNA-binding response OmpR family regulator